MPALYSNWFKFFASLNSGRTRAGFLTTRQNLKVTVAMHGKSELWFRWLQVACISVQVFGVFMVVWPVGTRAFFGALLLGGPSAMGGFQDAAMAYVDLLHAVLGAVLFGWATALLLLVRALYWSQPLVVVRLIAVSLAFWAVPDTAYSLWSGFWQNAVLNAVFIAIFVPPLVALRAAADH